jgi:two-component system, response regulator / RNA-binding antiterminator
MNSLLMSVQGSPLFTATAAPYLVLDRDLTICSANRAYLGATGRDLDELVGEFVFDAFPDNPHDPDADGVEYLNRSLESVLRTSQRSNMWVQRYDVPGPGPDDDFIVKYWSPINSPIRDDRGRAIGILHHVEDVTPVCISTARRGDMEPPADTVDPESLIALRMRIVASSHNQEAYVSLAREVVQLRQALTSRVVIEQARGIIMAERRCGPGEAFEILRKVSNDSNVRLRDLAAGLVAGLQQRPRTDG